MINKLIEKNIKKLTINDIKSFANKENVSLSDSESKIIYDHIKNDYNELLYGEKDKIFNQLKKEINNSLYLKIVDLYDEYYNKYKKFL